MLNVLQHRQAKTSRPPGVTLTSCTPALSQPYFSFDCFQDEAVKSCPKSLQANISSGLINLWGLQVPLPIKGSGVFEVLYLDDELRVFRSGLTYAVQVKEAALPALRKKFGFEEEA